MSRDLTKKQLEEMIAAAREIGIEIRMGTYDDGQRFWGTDTLITTDLNEFVYFLTGVADARLAVASDLRRVGAIVSQAKELARTRERIARALAG